MKPSKETLDAIAVAVDETLMTDHVGEISNGQEVATITFQAVIASKEVSALVEAARVVVSDEGKYIDGINKLWEALAPFTEEK